MKLENAEGIVPQKDMVVVNIHPRQTEGVYLGGDEQATKTKVEMYYGTVLATGPEVENDIHCPGLAEGEIGIFSQFAGSYIATNDDELYKIIRGYDIMAKTTELERSDEETLIPTADRMLVSIQHKDVSEEGLYLDADDARDPRLQDIEYGEVLKLGPTSKGFKMGDLVAFDHYVGETLRHRTSDDQPELRVVRCPDILFIKQ